MVEGRAEGRIDVEGEAEGWVVVEGRAEGWVVVAVGFAIDPGTTELTPSGATTEVVA